MPESLKGLTQSEITFEPAELPRLPAATTLFLPVTGNPISFNHFALAEWLLRSRSGSERIVLVISNGKHPDPTKPDADVSPADRYMIAQAAIEAIADPARCFLARQAELAGEPLLLNPERILLDPREFRFKTAVRTAQLVQMLRDSGVVPGDPKELLHWAVGADLVRRMADPAIFTDADIQFLSQNLHYAILERDGDPARAAVEMLRQRRGVTLAYRVLGLADVPAWLAPFLQLSSTLVRHAVQAGDPLGGMLPLPALEYLTSHGLYRKGRRVAQLITPTGVTLGERSALQLTLEGLQLQLDQEAAAVTALLVGRRAQGKPHGLAIGEGTVGGVLTQSLAGRSGASRFLRQARFFYDRQAKLNLLGEIPADFSAVSEEGVRALAKALRREAAADYALVESGMAGPPDGVRRSLKNGQTWLSVAGPDGEQTELIVLNPFQTRKEHMLHFSRRALSLLRKVLERG